MENQLYHQLYKLYLREAILSDGFDLNILKTDCSNEYHGANEAHLCVLPPGGIAPHLFAEVVCLEIDREKVDGCIVAHPPSKYPNVKFQEGDIRQIPYPDGFFDVVLDFSTLDHVPFDDGETVLKEYNRVLKVGGTLKLVVWTNPTLDDHASGNVFYYSWPKLNDCVSKYFFVLSSKSLIREVCSDFNLEPPEDKMNLYLWTCQKTGLTY